MIHLIVWSKDRAAQLHLLLESIEKNMTDKFITSVIFTYSSDYFKKGYERLREEFPGPRYLFHLEQDLRSDTMELISDKTYDNIAFSTDDTVIYKDANAFKESLMDSSIGTFSLRLGLNTLMQDCHAGIYQPPLNIYQEDGDTITWPFNMYHPNSNYGYVFGLDMHVYNRELMYGLTRYMPFKSTNELETGLFYKKLCIPQNIRSFKHSVAVNIPTNNISGITRHGETYEFTLDELNQEYLDGKTISLTKIMEQTIIGCHQELPLELNHG